MADANSLNQFTIVGMVGRDPKIVVTKEKGTTFAILNIALHEKFYRPGQDPLDKTTWIGISVWPKRQVDFVKKYVRKRMQVAIKGRIYSRKWTDRGEIRTVVDLKAEEVIVLRNVGLAEKEKTKKPADKPAATKKDPF